MPGPKRVVVLAEITVARGASLGKNLMSSYDLFLAWNWEYDADFAKLLGKCCLSRGLLLLGITPDNLADVMLALGHQELGFRALLDRASEADERFVPLAQWALEHGAYRINPSEISSRCSDKAAMQSLLLQAGLQTPRTILLPPYQEQPVLSAIDLDRIGERFIIKPAHGGGGEGVIEGATSLNQVLEARRSSPKDRYLLQARVVPRKLKSRPAWFRVIYCAGWVCPCWWDPSTHVYACLSKDEEAVHGLQVLRETASALAGLCQLDFFSTEIALTEDGHWVVVDYVNDQIDLRLQSKAADGVPDEVVEDIARRLTDLVVTHLGSP
jgi:hypothetical protein